MTAKNTLLWQAFGRSPLMAPPADQRSRRMKRASLACAALAIASCAIGLSGCAAVRGPMQPRQTIIQKTEVTGDVKRLCIEVKTGDRIDALSCDLIDDITGEIK